MEIFAVSDFLKSGTHGLQECFHPWDSPSRPFLQPHQLLLVRGDLSAFTYVLSNWKHVVFDWVKVSDLAMREQYFCCHWGKKTVSPFLHQHPFGSHIENSSEVLPNAISKPGIENCGVVQRQKCVIFFFFFKKCHCFKYKLVRFAK